MFMYNSEVRSRKKETNTVVFILMYFVQVGKIIQNTRAIRQPADDRKRLAAR
jgi:hypothetical protein